MSTMAKRRSTGRINNKEGDANAGKTPKVVAGGALYAIDLKTGKAAMVGKIEGLSGNLGDIAWVD